MWGARRAEIASLVIACVLSFHFGLVFYMLSLITVGYGFAFCFMILFDTLVGLTLLYDVFSFIL